MFEKIIFAILIFFQFNNSLYAQSKPIAVDLYGIDQIKNDSIALAALEKIDAQRITNAFTRLEINRRMITRANSLQKFDKALAWGFESVVLANQNNLDSLEALFNKLLGSSNYYMDRKKAAIPYFEKAIAIAHPNNFWELEASCYNNIGGTLADLSKHELAEPNLLKAIAIMEEHGDENKALLSYRVLARLYDESGKSEKAEALYLELIEKGKANKDTVFLCDNLMFYSDILSERGDVKAAVLMSAEALAFMRHHNNPSKLLAALGIHSTNLSLAGQHAEAYKLAIEATYLMRVVFANNLEEAISEVEVRYKTAQVIHEKKLAEANAKTQQQVYLFSFLGILILIASGGYFWNQRKNTRQKALRLAELAEIEKIRFKEMLEAEEKERLRIAQELHDGLGQLLSAARLNVASLEDSIAAEDLPDWTRSLKIIDEACTEVRNISHNMMPSTLVRLGLIPTIRELIYNINSSKGLKINFTTNTEDSFGQSLDITIYRVVQEILNNMLKHAQATEIDIIIEKNESNLKIVIKDNGVGFDTQNISNSKGMGWKNIFSRVGMLGGTVRVESELGKGIVVFVDLKI